MADSHNSVGLKSWDLANERKNTKPGLPFKNLKPQIVERYVNERRF